MNLTKPQALALLTALHGTIAYCDEALCKSFDIQKMFQMQASIQSAQSVMNFYEEQGWGTFEENQALINRELGEFRAKIASGEYGEEQFKKDSEFVAAEVQKINDYLAAQEPQDVEDATESADDNEIAI